MRAGRYAGLTAVTGSVCCLTDQRNFSNDTRAQSRMQSLLAFDFTSSPPAMRQWHRCDFTTECDCLTGEVACQRQADTSQMKCSLIATNPVVVVHIDCTSSNPCTSASWAFGNISYKGTVSIDYQSRSLALDLMIGMFPAFEGYAALNNGGAVTLFRHAPPAGMTAKNAPSGANRLIRSRIEDWDGMDSQTVNKKP